MNVEIQTPTWLVGTDGKPVAVMIDIATWESILERLENQDDFAILQSYASDFESMAAGKDPTGWMAWDAFEKELDELESTGVLPT